MSRRVNTSQFNVNHIYCNKWNNVYDFVKRQFRLSFSLHRFAFVPPPPHLPPSLCFSYPPQATIKSFTGLSHPMNRVMRICLLNWNSHLLPPRLRPTLFSLLSSVIALSFILVSSLFYSLSLFLLNLSPSPLHVQPFFYGGSITVYNRLRIPLFSLRSHICNFQMLLIIQVWAPSRSRFSR